MRRILSSDSPLDSISETDLARPPCISSCLGGRAARTPSVAHGRAPAILISSSIEQDVNMLIYEPYLTHLPLPVKARSASSMRASERFAATASHTFLTRLTTSPPGLVIRTMWLRIQLGSSATSST